MLLEASLISGCAATVGSGGGVSRAASTSWKRASSGAKILASTSFNSVKWRTSSLGRAVIASAKCVTPGKMSMGCSAVLAPE